MPDRRVHYLGVAMWSCSLLSRLCGAHCGWPVGRPPKCPLCRATVTDAVPATRQNIDDRGS
eukprot:5222938-Pyramimonas_sp.AAC.1